MAQVLASTTKRTLTGAGRRNKGKRGEREIINLLQPVVNEVFVAHGLEPPLLQRNLLQSDKGGCDVHGLEFLAAEVKFQETFAIPAWWQQTLRQAGTTRVPVLFYRRARMRDWQVMMRATLCPGCTVAATVPMEGFLMWFRLALNRELSHDSQ